MTVCDRWDESCFVFRSAILAKLNLKPGYSNPANRIEPPMFGQVEGRAGPACATHGCKYLIEKQLAPMFRISYY